VTHEGNLKLWYRENKKPTRVGFLFFVNLHPRLLSVIAESDEDEEADDEDDEESEDEFESGLI